MMFRKIALLSVASLASLAVTTGCVIDGSDSGANAAIEAQSDVALSYDPDSTKAGAFGLIFGMPAIDDRLDFEHGDKEDWRYIIVSEPGVMSITLNLDTPQNINGGWHIYDSEERVLHRQSFNQSQGFYEFPNFPVKEGIYYFQTFAMSGASIYTLGTSFTPRRPEPKPVVEEEVEEAPAKVTKPSSPKPSKPKESGEAKPAKKEEPAPAATGKKVVGFVSLITPKDDGSAEVTVRDAGKNKGVQAGDVGEIEGLGTKVKMNSCLSTSCKAILPASVNIKSLKAGANVVFYVN